MQLRILFQAPAFSIPSAYQHQVQSMIYGGLLRDPAFAALLHDRGYTAGTRQFRLFTFGRLSGRYLFQEGRLHFPEGFSLEIRSVSAPFIQLLMDSFREGSVHCLCGQEITVTRRTLSDTHIAGARAEIIARAPVTAYQTTPDGKTRYFSPAEPEFRALLSDNAARKWRSFCEAPLPDTLSITPSEQNYKKVVTRYKGVYITGWLGRFLLEGPQPLLDFLYQTGLGPKNAQGFGLFDVLH